METIQLNYQEIGTGFPVVLLHGFPLDHSIWDPVVAYLKEEARLILPDLRGQGSSPLGKENSIRNMAEDVLDLLEHLKISRAVIVGHSMGGYIALAFARAHPERLAGFAMVASQAEADSPEKKQGRLNSVEEVRQHGVRRLAETMSVRLTAHPELVEKIKKIILRAKPEGVIAALKAMADRPDATDWLADINVPAVVISGDSDAFIPLERAETLERLMPHAWRVILPGTGHMPMLEAPRETAHAIRELIQMVMDFKED